MQHLAGNFGEGGAAGAEVLPVAEDGMAGVLEMDADLVSAAGFDGDGDMRAARRPRLRGNLAHMAYGREMVHRQTDVHLRRGQVAGDQRMVDFADTALLELGDEGGAGRLGLGKQHAAGGVLVEAMDGAEFRKSDLIAQAEFEGLLAVGEEARGLVGHQKERIVHQNADGGRGIGLRSHGLGQEFHGIAGLQEMPGHPDAAAVDEDQAVIQEGFGGAPGKGEAFGQMVEQGGAVAADRRQAAQAGVFRGGAFHARENSGAEKRRRGGSGGSRGMTRGLNPDSSDCIRAPMNASDPQANGGGSGKPAERELDQTVLMECPVDPALRGAQDASEPAQSRPAYFMVISGHSIGKHFKLSGAMIIGRSVDCGIHLDDEGVSREHARVELNERGEIWISDLGSTNGTFFLDGRRIEKQILHNGDKIRLGPETILKLSLHDGLEEDFYQHQYDLATRDALTGIYNKRYFLDQLKNDFTYARRQQMPLSLIVFDVDHFKQINDVHGHPAGDFILKELAGVVGRALRSEDWFARTGGEEFAIIERAANEQQIRALAERIRRTVEGYRFLWDGHRIPVTISLGVATLWGENFRNIEALIRAADDFLYQAKEAGRNRVASALG